MKPNKALCHPDNPMNYQTDPESAIRRTKLRKFDLYRFSGLSRGELSELRVRLKFKSNKMVADIEDSLKRTMFRAMHWNINHIINDQLDDDIRYHER